jgi:hypothetical protein
MAWGQTRERNNFVFGFAKLIIERMLKQTTKKLASKIKYLFPAVFLLAPMLVFANEVQNGLNNSGFASYFGFGGGGISSSSSLTELIGNIIKIALTFAGAVAVVFVIIGGYQYITSAGNEEAAEKGKKTLINAIIGIIIIVMSYVVINVITNLVSSPSGNGY